MKSWRSWGRLDHILTLLAGKGNMCKKSLHNLNNGKVSTCTFTEHHRVTVFFGNLVILLWGIVILNLFTRFFGYY
jgi:hypothetical protein